MRPPASLDRITRLISERLWVYVAVAVFFVACGGGTFEPSGPGAGGGAGSRLGVAGWAGGNSGTAGHSVDGGAEGGRAGAGSLIPRGAAGWAFGGGGAAGSVGPGGAGASAGGRGGTSVGGRGGVGGGGGVVGRGGAGGAKTCGMVDFPEDNSCPVSLCGNGVRDNCDVSWGSYPFCNHLTFSEECDGADLGYNNSCEGSPGFASGTLRCSSACKLDTRGCTECMNADEAVVRCGDAPFTKQPATVVLGANDTEVGVAWVVYEGDEQLTPQLWFTRLAANLDGLSVTQIKDTTLTIRNDYGVSDVGSLAVTPVPSGWLVAAFVGSELFIHVLDAAGEDTGRLSVATPLNWAAASFVPRPDGGPLLVWATDDNNYNTRYRVSVIAADGRSMTAPFDLPSTGGALAEVGRGTFAGGTFYLPLTVNTGYSESQMQLARIGTDGRLVSVVNLFEGVSGWSPQLTAGHDQLQLTYLAQVPDYGYYGYRTGLFWQPLLLSGEVAGASFPLDSVSALLPPVAVGGDTVLLTGSGNSGDGLELVRVDGAGQFTVHHPVVRATYVGFEWFDVVARGPDAVLAWFVSGNHTLRLARITP